MSKTYKGWELMKAIAEGEIKEGSRIINNTNRIFEFDGSNFRDTYEGNYLIDIYDEIDLVTAEFELLENEIDIDSIEELEVRQNYGCEIINEDNIHLLFERQNEILQAVKQIDKRVKKLEENK